jgi:predicted TIM-barrel fold metal-dependent hydrolase
MIDTHVHAFPGLPGVIGGLAARIPVLGLGLDIGRAAKMRKRGGQGRINQAIEMGAGLALLPQVMLRGRLADLSASMDRHGITRSVVIGGGKAAPNNWLLDACRDDPHRFIPVTTLPFLRAGAGEREFEAEYNELAERGARGFKIHPNMDGLPADHPAYRTLFKVADERKLFVILHTGCFCTVVYKHLRPADPNDYTAYFDKYPKLRVCLAHMNRDEPQVAWALMRKYPRLYTDTSWQSVEAVRTAIAEAGPERILLGSDWPLLHGNLQGDARGVLERAASPGDAERIGTANALAFLGE